MNINPLNLILAFAWAAFLVVYNVMIAAILLVTVASFGLTLYQGGNALQVGTLFLFIAALAWVLWAPRREMAEAVRDVRAAWRDGP